MRREHAATSYVSQVNDGALVLACSVILPLFKLLAIFVLTSGWVTLAEHHRATTYRLEAADQPDEHSFRRDSWRAASGDVV